MYSKNATHAVCASPRSIFAHCLRGLIVASKAIEYSFGSFVVHVAENTVRQKLSRAFCVKCDQLNEGISDNKLY